MCTYICTVCSLWSLWVCKSVLIRTPYLHVMLFIYPAACLLLYAHKINRDFRWLNIQQQQKQQHAQNPVMQCTTNLWHMQKASHCKWLKVHLLYMSSMHRASCMRELYCWSLLRGLRDALNAIYSIISPSAVRVSLVSADSNLTVPVVNVIFNSLERILPNMYSNGR